jgi:hypothetical protein
LKKKLVILIHVLFSFNISFSQNIIQKKNIERIKNEKGLIAFWDFWKTGTYNINGTNQLTWDSYFDSAACNKSFPILLKRVTDTTHYVFSNWPYKDTKIVYDSTGPLGKGVKMNRGYLFAEIPRFLFDKTTLNINRNCSFTIITWIKFYGKRHCIAGIWDEGNWTRYSGNRQFALFSGVLAGYKGVLCHISTTGSGSFPQSTLEGTGSAREAAFAGRDVPNNEWHTVGATYNHITKELSCFIDGIISETYFIDQITQNVYNYPNTIRTNPFFFNWPIYDPLAFTIKFTGYNLKNEREHWIYVDLRKNIINYGQDIDYAAANNEYEVVLEIKRQNKLLIEPFCFTIKEKNGQVNIPNLSSVQVGDVITASLYKKDDNGNFTILVTDEGGIAEKRIEEGAPFTLCKASGTSLSGLDDGSDIIFDGVAIFNRVLSSEKIQEISAITHLGKYYIDDIKGSKQECFQNYFNQEIEIALSGENIPTDGRFIVDYENHRTISEGISKNKFVTISNLSYMSIEKIDSLQFIHIEMQDKKGNTLCSWTGKRFFSIPFNQCKIDRVSLAGEPNINFSNNTFEIPIKINLYDTSICSKQIEINYNYYFLKQKPSIIDTILLKHLNANGENIPLIFNFMDPYCVDTINNLLIAPQSITPKNNFFSVHPNPFNKDITLVFNYSDSETIFIEVLNIEGRIIFKDSFLKPINTYSHKITLDNIPNGFYFIYASSNKRKGIEKIIRISSLTL